MLPENVTRAREEATSAATSAGNLAAGEYTIGDILKKKVTEAYQDNQDVIGKLDTATATYTGAPSAAREKFSGIFNPTQREALVSEYTGNQSIPMLSLSSILGQRFGRIEDTIGAGTRGYQGMVAGEQSRATNLQNLYANLLNEYELTKPTYTWVDLGGTKALVDEKGNIIKSMAVTKAPGTGDSGAYDLAEALRILGITGDETGVPERPPIEMALEEDNTPAPTPQETWTPQQGWPSPFNVLSGLKQNQPTSQPKQTYPTQGWPKPPGY
jgi:hypothetical protein